jgi:GcrA cell cycle regulator
MSEGAWTIEREELLAKLWNEGASASQVANALGVSRNSVMGKVNRLGLQRYAQKSPEEIEREAEARRIRSAELAKARYERELARRRKVQELFDAEKIEQERKSSSLPFSELRMFSSRLSNQCRYMLNDTAPFIACGAVTAPGDSWCPYCRDIVMAKPAPVLSDDERFRRALAFKKNALARSVTKPPTARDEAA